MSSRFIITGALGGLTLLLSACASTPAPGSAAMRITPQPCVVDQLQYPDPCGPAAPDYYYDAPYSYAPYPPVASFPGIGFPPPPPIRKPPPVHPGTPPPKTGRPAPMKPCPRGDKACP